MPEYDETRLAQDREEMVRTQIEARGITDERVLEAMRRVPRHRFVHPSYGANAYEDRPLPIGQGQTISQPFIVAFMTNALAIEPDESVLEIGTGSGYQAAALSNLAREVFTIEIVESLARRAQRILEQLGCDNVHSRCSDGYHGWPEEAPFDSIVLTAAPTQIPGPLLDQLALGGRMILPLGDWEQELVLIRRTAEGFEESQVMPVRFVPMTGEAQERFLH